MSYLYPDQNTGKEKQEEEELKAEDKQENIKEIRGRETEDHRRKRRAETRNKRAEEKKKVREGENRRAGGNKDEGEDRSEVSE
jgi:hypothetical protein